MSLRDQSSRRALERVFADDNLIFWPQHAVCGFACRVTRAQEITGRLMCRDVSHCVD